ncbi:hypothetical protein ADUPG1_010558, partial [Aduncisulcus paluster]
MVVWGSKCHIIWVSNDGQIDFKKWIADETWISISTVDASITEFLPLETVVYIHYSSIFITIAGYNNSSHSKTKLRFTSACLSPIASLHIIWVLFAIMLVLPIYGSSDVIPDSFLLNDVCLALNHGAHCDDLTSDDLQDLTSLNTYFVDSFAGLGGATNLTTLYVSNTSSVSKQMGTSDIEQLPTSLETLTLNNIDIAPNTDFSRLTSLRALYLTVGDVSSGDYWATQLSSLSPLFDSDNNYDVTVQGMFPASLTTLSVAGRTSVTFPTFFTSLALSDGSALPALTTLDLSGTNVVDLSPLPASVTQYDYLADFMYLETYNTRDFNSIPSTVTELIIGFMAYTYLDFIDNLPNLIHLEISSCIVNLSKLIQVKDTLEYLSFRDAMIEGDCMVLGEFQNLKYLELENSGTCFNSPDLSSLTKLSHLILSGWDSYDEDWDISWISTLTQLEYLVLDGSYFPAFDITSIDVSNLKVLDISSYDITIDSYAFLNEATNLESLRIGKKSDFDVACVNIPDMSNLPNLRQLSIACPNYFDESGLENIAQLSKLESLTLISTPSSSSIETPDISSLSLLSSLKVLNMNDVYKLIDVSIPSFPSLEYLGLPNPPSDFTSVPDFSTVPKLRVFSWEDNNHITDFSNLSTASTLQSIMFPRCGLSDATQFSSVISSIAGLTDLTIFVNEPTNFDLGSATDLRHLKFFGSWSDMSEAIIPPNISELILIYMQLIHGPDLSSLTSLQVLDFGYNAELSDISFLATESCYSLKKLVLAGRSVEDISLLSMMTSLEWLDLFYNAVSNISPLKDLVSLKYLNLAYNAIEDISSLSALISLKYLYLRGNNITDISPLSSLVGLGALFISDNSITDISPLSSFESLVFLSIEYNDIDDASSLSSCTSLFYMDISHNNISDISFVASLPNLLYIVGYKNSISDISVLSSMEQLRHIELDDNLIEDITPIVNLPFLSYIDLSGNLISDVSPLSSFESSYLEYLSLFGNMISDVSPLFDITNVNESVELKIELGNNNICFGNEDEGTLIALFKSKHIGIYFGNQTCNCPSLDPDSDSTIAAISEGLVCSETAPSSETWTVTCMSDSYYTYSDSDTFTCTRSADCSGGCGYGSECRANSDGTHSCASVVPDVALHGCVSDMIDAADKVAVGDGTYEFGVASLKNISASTSLTCPSSSVSSLADCSGGCGYGSECRANSDGTHSCASVVPDVALHGCVSDMIDAADKVAVGDGTYEFGVASLKNISASTSLTCPSSSVSSLAGVEHIGSMTSINVSSNSIANISPLTTLSALTSIDVHSNQISDVSVLINENGSTTPLPSDVLLSLNISDNLICDIADVNSELTSYFTNSSFSLESSESEQTCMCSPEPDFSENEICSKNSSDTWGSKCWNGYYYDEGLELCVVSSSNIEIPDENLKNAICTQLGYSSTSDCTLNTVTILELTTLSASNVDSFEGLSSATNLLSLSVDGTATSSLEIGNTSMSDLPTSLELLSLANISLASDLSLSFLTNLEELLLDSDGNLIIGYVFIEDLPTSLQSISISSINITSDIDFSSLESLKELTLDSIDRVLTNAMISTLPASLTSVSILDSVFEFPIDFSGLKSLVSLTLNKNEISELGGFVSSLPPSLSSLDLSANSISDPTPLYSVSFTSLVSLDLDDNLICGMDADGIGDVKTRLSLASFSASANTCNCSALTSSFSFESGIVCKESWSDHWEPTCCSSCYHDVSVSISSDNSACVLIDRTESPEMYEKCHNLSSDNMLCAGDGSDGTEVSSNTISIMCIDGWYGKECTSECPVDSQDQVCKSEHSSGCNTLTHQCTCTDSYVGDLCTIAPNVTLGTLNMDAVLKHSICTSLGFSSTNCDDSSFVDDIGIEEVETISGFTVRNTVRSIE